tara:strand:- start:1416 stop:1664 length:249 start_codon:yes stop_codon:yes gene_type:complete
MKLIEIKTATITEKGQIAIPKDVRNQKGFKKGSKIAILAFKNHIELRPLNQISKGMATMLASEKSLEKDWNTKEEDKSWKNL